jgi:prophage regulatory protein
MAHQLNDALRALRRKQVEERTGSTRSTLYRWISNGSFPRPIRLGSRSVGWLEHEVSDWLAQRALERDTGATK